jgi:hypothetical protein
VRPVAARARPVSALLLSSGSSSSAAPRFLLVTGFGLVLLALLAAAAPTRSLPRQVAMVLDGRRESLGLTAVGVLFALLIALLIARGGS